MVCWSLGENNESWKEIANWVETELKKSKQRTRFKPPDLSLIQWHPRTHLEYDGMTLLKSQDKWGSFDWLFDISCYYNDEEFETLNDGPQPCPSLSNSRQNQTYKSVTELQFRMICWSLGESNVDSGKKSRIKLKLHLKIEAANSSQTSHHLLPSIWYNDSYERT